jgi:hypothetical protein
MTTLRRKIVALGAAAAMILTTGTFVAARALSKDALTPREQIAAQHKAAAGSHHMVRLATRAFDPLKDVPKVAAGLQVSPAASDYWLVQVEYPATKATRLAITSTGAEILGALPDVTYLVRANPAIADAVKGIDGVRWVGAYEPAYKIAPGLDKTLEKTKSGGAVRVWAHEGVDARRLGAAVVAITGQKLRESRQANVVAVATKDHLAALARLEDVAWIEQLPTYKLHNGNAVWLDDTGERDKQNATAPGHLDGKGQTAAVADTGINYIPDDNGRAQMAFSDCANGTCKLADWVSNTPGNTDEALADTKATGSNHRKMAAYFNLDADDPNARSLEGSWHGTHVSGSVAGDYPDAAGNYGTRSREADGIAVGARLVFQDIEADGGLGGLPASPYDLFQQVYDLNGNGQYDPNEDARTHNNSYGAIFPEVDDGGGFDTDRFVHDHPDMTIVFSASNDGPDPATLAGGPQEAKNILTSCAATNGRQPLVSPDAVAIFSSHGPTIDGRIKPDVCTPGQINVSPKGGTVDDDQYLQGTSMSGPMLVGFVTLVRQYFWDGFGPSGIQGYARGTRDFNNRHNPSAALVKAVTINSAQRMRGFYSGDDGGDRSQDGMWPSMGQGWGKVELDKALYFPGDDRALFTVDRPNDDANGLETGNSVTEEIDVVPGQPLDVTVAWTDPESPLPGGSPTLVNDLDLVVTAPDGTEYLGNEFTTQSPLLGPGGDPAADVHESVPNATLPDVQNNVEGVRLADPKPGRYKVTVSGSNVQDGPQGYSMAVSGRIATDQPRIVFDAPKYKPGATATAYLLGTTLSGDTAGDFAKVGDSLYSKQVTAAGTQVALSGGGVSASAPVDSTAPAVSNLHVESVASDLAKVTWTTDENSTGEVVINGPDGEKVFGDVYAVESFPGLGTAPAETKGNWLNKKVNTTKHETLVSGTAASQAYSYKIRSVDEAGNSGESATGEFTSTGAMFSPKAPDIAMLLEGDLTTGLPETPDLNTACGVTPVTTCQPWGTSTQLYAGSFASNTLPVEAMPAFMFRLPSSVDPSKITGAAVEMYTGHDIVDTYTDDTVYSLSLLDSAAETGWGPGKKYLDVKGATADVKMAPDITLRRGANQAYTWQVPCNQLEAFKTNLSEDSGDERRAAFRLEAKTTLDESLFSFETGYGRRSRGPQLRPRLVLFMDGLDPMPCNATAAPEITNLGVDHVEDTSAVVSWRTDVPSDSTVYFRKTGTTDWTPVSAPVRVTQHFVRVDGLEANGPYEFVVRSATCNGLVTVDDNGGKSYALYNEAFEPAVLGGFFARPKVDDPGIEEVGWGSSQKTTSVVSYGTSPNALTTQVSDDASTDTHLVPLPDLAPCTRYYFKVSGVNGAGAVSESPVMAFDTAGATLADVVSYDFAADEQGWTNDPPEGTGTEGDPLIGEQIADNPTIWDQLTDPAMQSGAMRTVLKTTGQPGYSSNVNQRLVSPPIAVPAGYSILEWREWFLFEQGAEGVFEPKEEPIVELSMDDGATWVKLRNGVLTQNADFPEPNTTRLALPSTAAGHTVRVAFHMSSDGNTEPPGGGWAIDDVKVLNATCGPIAVVDPSVPVVSDVPPQRLSEQAIHELVGPIAPVDGSGNAVGVLPALVAPPTKASLDAGTCRCSDIRFLGQAIGGPVSGGAVGAAGAPHPATGGATGLWAALAGLMAAAAMALRRGLRGVRRPGPG